MSVVRAKTSTHITPFVMLRGNDDSGLVELWDADDPIVLAHPEHFTTDLESVARRSSPKVEAATAEPARNNKMRTATSEPALN